MSMQVHRESQPRNESIFEGHKKGIRLRLSFFLSLLLSLLFLSNFAFGQAITSFTPTTVSIGSTVTITGTDLTGASAVRFNGLAAPIISANATIITATIPTGATTGTIAVATPRGTTTRSSYYFVVGQIVAEYHWDGNLNESIGLFGPATFLITVAANSVHANGICVCSTSIGFTCHLSLFDYYV